MSEKPENDKKCAFERAGVRCGMWKLKGSAFCFTHSSKPEIVEQRSKALEKASKSREIYIPLNMEDAESIPLELPKKINLKKSKHIRRAYTFLIQAAFGGQMDENKVGKLVFALNGYCAQIEKIELLELVEKLERLLKKKGIPVERNLSNEPVEAD